jgi:hypothetical protein
MGRETGWEYPGAVRDTVEGVSRPYLRDPVLVWDRPAQRIEQAAGSWTNRRIPNPLHPPSAAAWLCCTPAALAARPRRRRLLSCRGALRLQAVAPSLPLLRPVTRVGRCPVTGHFDIRAASWVSRSIHGQLLPILGDDAADGRSVDLQDRARHLRVLHPPDPHTR